MIGRPINDHNKLFLKAPLVMIYLQQDVLLRSLSGHLTKRQDVIVQSYYKSADVQSCAVHWKS